jgi:hypothetical protein
MILSDASRPPRSGLSLLHFDQKMAIIEFPFPNPFSIAGLAQSPTFTSLNNQGRTEMCESARVIEVWRDWIEQKFGTFAALLHRSDGDDPPDLDLRCAESVVAFEHTKLLPYQIGWAVDLLKEVSPDQATSIPSILNRPENRDALLDAMVIGSNVNPPHDDVTERWNRVRQLLDEALHEKIGKVETVRKRRGLESCGIVAIINEIAIGNHDFLRSMEIAAEIIDESHFATFGDFTVLISTVQPGRYRSSLVRRGEPILKRSSDGSLT